MNEDHAKTNISRIVKAIRSFNNYSQSEFARIIDENQSYLSKVENQIQAINITFWYKIVAEVGIDSELAYYSGVIDFKKYNKHIKDKNSPYTLEGQKGIRSRFFYEIADLLEIDYLNVIEDLSGEDFIDRLIFLDLILSEKEYKRVILTFISLIENSDHKIRKISKIVKSLTDNTYNLISVKPSDSGLTIKHNSKCPLVRFLKCLINDENVFEFVLKESTTEQNTLRR